MMGGQQPILLHAATSRQTELVAIILKMKADANLGWSA